jgi:uncharacterized protein
MLIDGGWSAWGAEAGAKAAFSPEVFDYTAPERLEVKEQPIRQPYALSNTRQQEVVFKDVRGQDVPVLITMPAEGSGPFPLVVLAHGYTSNKEEVTRQLGRVLTQRGIACIAFDLPHHGERPGEPKDMFPVGDQEKTYKNMVEAVVDLRQAIDFAETRGELKASVGVGLAGYSLGSWVGTLAAASDRRIGPVVLMVGGTAAMTASRPSDDLPGLPGRLDLIRRFPVLRHDLAVAHISPRPLLMQNGRKDVLVPAERAKTLFQAAKDPKEIRWYDSGHLLPVKAYLDAADWLELRVKSLR